MNATVLTYTDDGEETAPQRYLPVIVGFKTVSLEIPNGLSFIGVQLPIDELLQALGLYPATPGEGPAIKKDNPNE